MELQLGIELVLIGQTLESDFIQRIRCIADQLTKEDFLVAVESVDDKAEKLVDLSLEGEHLSPCHLHFRHRNRKSALMQTNGRVEDINKTLSNVG